MRKKNSIYNIIATLGASISAIVFNFITQRFLILILGIEYSGANGLFSNILNLLSIAELGIGSAIVFKLYKPIAENDIENIRSWMNFYKLCYRWIAIFILIVGLFLIPVIPMIVGNTSIQENIKILYLISLIDVVLSYTLTYKRSLLYAQQKNYIVNIIHMVYLFFVNFFQIIILIIFKKYIFFISIKIVFRLLENLIINFYVNKNYSSMVNGEYKSISKEEKIDIYSRIKAIFVQKIAYQINKGIDNIVVTVMLGIISSGFYSNYSLIIVAILRILYWITSSMTASVGNLLTESNRENSYKVYRQLNLFNALLTCICVVGFASCVQSFISIWVGKNYLLSYTVVFSFSFYIYSDGIRNIIRLFKDASGICKEDKNTYIVALLINVILSISLCKIIGLSGVILSTAISYIYLYLYSYPKYIFKKIFNKSVIYYYLDNLKFFIYILISIIVSILLCNILSFNSSILELIKNIVISVTISVLNFIIIFKKSDEFEFCLNYLKKILRKRRYKKYEK